VFCIGRHLTRNTPIVFRVLGESLQAQANQDLVQDDTAPSPEETSTSNGSLVSRPISEDADKQDLEECRSRRGGVVVQTLELPATTPMRSSSFTVRSTAATEFVDEQTKPEWTEAQ
jgi:hypothetical protein